MCKFIKKPKKFKGTQEKLKWNSRELKGTQGYFRDINGTGIYSDMFCIYSDIFLQNRR